MGFGFFVIRLVWEIYGDLKGVEWEEGRLFEICILICFVF